MGTRNGGRQASQRVVHAAHSAEEIEIARGVISSCAETSSSCAKTPSSDAKTSSSDAKASSSDAKTPSSDAELCSTPLVLSPRVGKWQKKVPKAVVTSLATGGEKATQIAPCQLDTTNGTKIRKKCTIIVKIRTKLNYVTEKFINFAVSKNFLTATGFLQRRV